jgi:hypothetical protein
MTVQILIWGARAEAAHPDKSSGRADNRIPALADAGFDRDIDLCCANHGGTLGFRASQEQLETGYRNNTRQNFPRCEKLARFDGERERSGLVMTPAMGPAMAPAMGTCNRGAMRRAAFDRK